MASKHLALYVDDGSSGVYTYLRGWIIIEAATVVVVVVDGGHWTTDWAPVSFS